MEAADIIALLRIRHRKDVFVRECKTGGSWGFDMELKASHRRMDAWVMARSWTKPFVWVYEIKMSRADFLADKKWIDYLPYGSVFYFVCPWGVIKPEELREEVGLVWVTKNGKALRTRKRAVIRKEPIRESVFRYVLMARARIIDDMVTGEGMMKHWDLADVEVGDYIRTQTVNKMGDRNLDGAIIAGRVVEINVKYDFAKLESGWCCHTKDKMVLHVKKENVEEGAALPTVNP